MLLVASTLILRLVILCRLDLLLNFLRRDRARGNIDALTQEPQVFGTEELIGVKQGCYIGTHGPNYETDAEVTLFRSLGADAVGMSTIPEIETALKRGMKVRAFSIYN